jgi:hypothetical protein
LRICRHEEWSSENQAGELFSSRFEPPNVPSELLDLSGKDFDAILGQSGRSALDQFVEVVANGLCLILDPLKVSHGIEEFLAVVLDPSGPS